MATEKKTTNKATKSPAKKRTTTAELKKRIAELEAEVKQAKEALYNSQNDYGKCLETLINERGGKSKALGYVLYGLSEMGISLEMVALKCQAIAKNAAGSSNDGGR